MLNLLQFVLYCLFFQFNMWLVFISCIIFLSATFVFSAFCDPVIKIKTGEVRGHILKSRDGRDFFSFSGIPYAKPPIDDLRFMVIFKIKYLCYNKLLYGITLNLCDLF